MFLDELFPAVEIQVPLVTDELYEYGVGKAVRTFFRESEVWCSPFDFVKVGESVNEFELEPFEDSVVHSVRAVLINGKTLTAASYTKIKAMACQTGTPTHYHKNGNIVYLAPTPTKEFDLDILGVSIPAIDAVQVVADSYMNKYSDAIVSLAVFYILSMPQKPWSNKGSASIHYATYKEDLVIARREALGYLEGYSNIMDYSGDDGYKNSDY